MSQALLRLVQSTTHILISNQTDANAFGDKVVEWIVSQEGEVYKGYVNSPFDNEKAIDTLTRDLFEYANSK
jgi:hypothetical protein